MLSIVAVAMLLSSITVSQADKSAHQAIAYRGAKILTATGATFSPGTLVVQNGKILAVGLQDQITLPDDAKVIDLSGKVIIPGLVDTHSHIGLFGRPSTPGGSDGNESSGPVQSIGRAVDAVNPLDPGFRMATAGGITTANIMPGSGNVIGGQTIYVKLRGNTIDEMRIQSAKVVGGLKMANGENPKRSYATKNQAPFTRMKIAALQRSEFVKAKEYLAKWDRFREKVAKTPDATPPEANLELEPLVEVLQRKRTVHFHSHRADDILTTIRLAEEFGFELVVQHGTESYKVADELAKRKIPVSMTVVDSPGGKAEVIDLIEECGAQLSKKGVKVLVNTDDPITESRFLLRTAATTVRGGLAPEEALKAITLYPAQVMHLDDRIGSLEKGKDADFVVLSGEPFSVYTRVLETYIEGNKVFDYADGRERLYQTGGFAVEDSKKPRAPAEVKDRPPHAKPPEMPPNAPKGNSSSTELIILAGRLHTVAKGTIVGGVLHIKDGKIVYAGAQKDFALPNGVPVLSAISATPGLIDAYSVVPLAGQYNIPADQDQDEKSGPIQPELRVLDAFHPREALLRFLLEQGITVIHACPGMANVIAGQTGVFRTHGSSAEQMTVRFPQAMLFNLGNSPKAAYPNQKPGTRMATAGLIRTALSQAAGYAKKMKSTKDEPPKPDRSLAHEAIGLVLERKIPAMFSAHRSDDIVTALRLSSEFNLKPILTLATDGYLIADQIEKAKAPVIVHPTMQIIGQLESFNTFLGNAAMLADRKIPIAIASGFESYVPKSRVARHEAAIAMVNGLGFERALRAVTLGPAEILDIADRFGSLEAGKVADIVLYDGDPFEYTTHVLAVIVDGRLIYNRQERQQIPFDRRVMLSNSVEIPCCLAW